MSPHEDVEGGDEVVLRLTWTGRVGEAARPFAAGQELCAHIVQRLRALAGNLMRRMHVET